MSVTAGLGKLRTAAKELRMQWNEVQVEWHDDNMRRFQANHIEPLFVRVRMVELALAQMASVLEKARQDCG
ncbi:MAG: hypothetical protein GX547_14140 [Phycisphaerae bacterium]|nr:hypothetical protein [Phycisphaerae bacterium]